MLNPKEISEKTFDKTFGFGYRMDDVEAYLKQVADELAQQQEINADLEKKLEVLADKLTEYREDEESLRTALLGAQKLGDSVIRESKTKAEIIMRDATIKAEAMINNAKRQIEREHESLERLQREVASFKNRLLALYKQHLELVSALPGEIEEEQRKKEKEISEPQPASESEPQAEPQPVPQPELQPEDEIFIERKEPVEAEDELDPDTEPQQELSFFDEDIDDEDDETEDEDDEADESQSAMSSQQKFGDLRFGEAYKIKRDTSFPRFTK